jgi:hypothetical protein
LGERIRAAPNVVTAATTAYFRDPDATLPELISYARDRR